MGVSKATVTICSRCVLSVAVSLFASASTLAVSGTKPTLASHPPTGKQQQPSGREVIAYLFPQDRVLDPGEVDARKITRINYAFANLKNGELIEGFPSDAQNFALLNGLKHDNPSLKIVISVGGWTWSDGFSDAALTRESRRRFIDSSVRFIYRYKLDGIDIDWEYPGIAGHTDHFRPQDKQNYTLLLMELRRRLDEEGKRLGRHFISSIATGASTNFLAHTEMGKVARYVDSVNLMTYDYSIPGVDARTGHDAPLMGNASDPKRESVDRTVREYREAGVPAAKLVLGVPFYGRGWGDVEAVNHGLFQQGTVARNLHFSYSTLNNFLASGYIRYWDKDSLVPYLYNETNESLSLTKIQSR
jgi:chitinase